ncbi:DUF1963 domain-containing protein [Xanthomonas sp. AM6]|uniref:DUF1963 domain-containing protein n=1 Tax=Xanthomonas sp. AM6 TaxID=2982531 RepID=UPI0021D949B7|nr:DUF1963 domain-containing protein [Xanthomonas sp. AM6]UYB51905.1 DUF1963 domain-containing protein [Xanthomonas sp. AM6]
MRLHTHDNRKNTKVSCGHSTAADATPMRRVQTDALSIDLPDRFTVVRQVGQFIKAAYPVADDEVSLGIVIVQRESPPDAAAADPWVDFRAQCRTRRGEVTVLAEQELAIDGRPALQMTVQGNGYAYLFAMVPLDDALYLDIVGDCPAGTEAEHFPVLDDALRSLRVTGDPAAALAAHDAWLQNMFGSQDDEDGNDDGHPAPVTAPAEPFRIPEDGRDVFLIDDLSLDFRRETGASIGNAGSTGDELVIDLQARARKADAAARAHLVDDAKVYFRFSVKGIHRAGVPTGRIRFEDDREPAHQAYLWSGGLRYDLKLWGELVLEQGWVGFSGYLQAYGSGHRYPVRIAHKLATETLDWSNYRFSSMDELSSAAHGVPRHAQLSNLAGPTLPEALYAYPSLRSLSIYYDDETAGANGLRELPDAIARFSALEELSVVRAKALEHLPASLGTLRALRRLHITGSGIRAVPPELLSLPLMYCVLDDNALEQLPEVPFPATLKTLSLAGNQLQTVPAGIAALPALQRLDLTNNPLTALPAGLECIERLELELPKKHALLDYRYKGADGQGTVAFDDDAYFVRSDPGLARQLEQALASDAQWSPHHPGMHALAWRAIALATDEADDYRLRGNTRFGGLPDLPPDLPYPRFTAFDGTVRPMQFIAQLDCAQLAPLQTYLPREGVLYFFISDQEDLTPQVFHYAGPRAALQTAADLASDATLVDDQDGGSLPYRASAASWISVPHFYSDEAYYQGAAAGLDGLEEAYELVESLRDRLAAQSTVSPVHGVNSHVFKQHDTPLSEAANRLHGRPEDFIVLLRVASDANPGFCFWDAGELYFVIHKSDLAKQDFSNVYCGLESS